MPVVDGREAGGQRGCEEVGGVGGAGALEGEVSAWWVPSRVKGNFRRDVVGWQSMEDLQVLDSLAEGSPGRQTTSDTSTTESRMWPGDEGSPRELRRPTWFGHILEVVHLVSRELSGRFLDG